MWSESIKQLTRDVICELAFVPRNDVVYFKNQHSQAGVIDVSNLLSGNLRLKCYDSGAEVWYASAEDLLEDGWVVD